MDEDGRDGREWTMDRMDGGGLLAAAAFSVVVEAFGEAALGFEGGGLGGELAV